VGNRDAPSPSVSSRAAQNHTTSRLDHPRRSLKRIGRGRQEEGIIDHEDRMRVEREIARTTPKHSIPLKFQRRGRRVCGNQRKLRSLAAGWTVARPRRHWHSRYLTGFTDVVGRIVGERLFRRCHVGVPLQPVAAACIGSGRGQEAQASNDQADNAAWLHRRQPGECHSCRGQIEPTQINRQDSPLLLEAFQICTETSSKKRCTLAVYSPFS
jgi:hypothetical protein